MELVEITLHLNSYILTNEMKEKLIFTTFLTLTLLSCHRTDEKFCSCMDKSEEVNALTEKIWQRKATKEDSVLLKNLIAAKNEVCEMYALKDGEELLKLREDCK
jgi:hypothetical protein